MFKSTYQKLSIISKYCCTEVRINFETKKIKIVGVMPLFRKMCFEKNAFKVLKCIEDMIK